MRLHLKSHRFPCSLEPEKSALIHDVTLRVHPCCHVNCVQFSFNDPTLPSPFFPADASAHINFAVGCFILHPLFSASGSPCPFLLRLAFPQKTILPTCSTLLVCRLSSLVALGSTQPNLFVSKLHVTFAFLPPLFMQVIPQENCLSRL